MLLIVPSNSLEINTENIAPIFWLLFDLLGLQMVKDLVIEIQFVDCDHVLSSEVLQSPCEEGLREEKSYARVMRYH